MAITDGTIHSPRLDLVPFSAPALEVLLAGDVATAAGLLDVRLPDDLGVRARSLLTLRLGDLRTHPGAEAWLLRVVALRTQDTPDRPMIGLTGFHGPPDVTGSVELGYEILPAHRRHGYAVETAVALRDWALAGGRARRVVAAVRPDNVASLAVVARLGFSPAGSRWDAIDGTALLFEERAAAPRWRSATVGGDAKMPGRSGRRAPDGHGDRHGSEAGAMTDETEIGDIYPDRPADETRTIGHRLRDVFRAHRADPADPVHRCLCGYDGESYDDHLAWSTLRDMKEVGYVVYPARHG